MASASPAWSPALAFRRFYVPLFLFPLLFLPCAFLPDPFELPPWSPPLPCTLLSAFLGIRSLLEQVDEFKTTEVT
jgi:hypothetical protein